MKKKKKPSPPQLVIDQALLDNLYRLGNLCLSMEQIRKYYQLDAQPWYDVLEANPKMRVAIEMGKSHRIESVISRLLGAIDKGNLSAIMFFLKSQAGWRENVQGSLDQETAPRPAMIVAVNDPIEAAKVYQQIMLEGAKA